MENDNEILLHENGNEDVREGNVDEELLFDLDALTVAG